MCIVPLTHNVIRPREGSDQRHLKTYLQLHLKTVPLLARDSHPVEIGLS